MNAAPLTHWEPENPDFWARQGGRIARRNLWISVLALMLSFAVWMVWSVVVVNLPHVGFRFSTNQLFWLAALPALCGATLRIFYAFMVPMFGGRVWTTLSTASLLLPALGIGFAVQDPDTTYPTLLLLALLCGLGGGNFASSMANISFFFPASQKGIALGLNAGLGNLGVSVAQFVVPLVIIGSLFGAMGGAPQVWSGHGEAREIWLQNAGFVWVPAIVLATLAAWFGMNDIPGARASFSEQAVIFVRKHNWLMSWLYLGTFGSFIGHAAGFPLLLQTAFPAVEATQYVFVGPLAGALMRPLGGWLADHLGGARVTFWNFLVMALAVAAALFSLPSAGSAGSLPGFLGAFLLLFLTAGIGNGSTFRMIPVIFMAERQRAALGKGPQAQDQAVKDANKEAAAVLGFTSAIGAYGGFFIPKSYGSSIAITGGPEAALCVFIVFYVTCIAMTWWYYFRKNAEMPC
jgi:NNP family nitrate/nitrite transporter-like MFS transporter